MAASPVLVAQDAPQAPNPPSAPEPPQAPTGPTETPVPPTEPSNQPAFPTEGGKSPWGKRDMPFVDFSYRFHIEDGGPQPASFHDWRIGLGFGTAEGPDRGDWMLKYGRLVTHGRRHAKARGEMDAYGTSFAFGFGQLKSLRSPIDEEASIEDERPYRVHVPRVELEVGAMHLDRFWIGQAPGSKLDNLNGRTGFRIGVLAEVAVLGFTAQYSYAREYYSSSGTVKDQTALIKFEIVRNIGVSFGHRRLSVKNYHRTMFLYGIEVGF